MGSMNLTDSFLSNSIKSYLIVLAILLVAFIIKRIISRFFAGLIYTWIVKNNHAELKKGTYSEIKKCVELTEKYSNQ
jgi:hypothetical protein